MRVKEVVVEWRTGWPGGRAASTAACARREGSRARRMTDGAPACGRREDDIYILIFGWNTQLISNAEYLRGREYFGWTC